MKTMLDLAKVSGSLGFSDACPLGSKSWLAYDSERRVASTRASTGLREKGASATDHPAHTAWTAMRSATSTMSSTFA